MKRNGALRSIFLLAVALALLPASASAETKRRTCGSAPGQTLQHFLDELNPGDTLLVSGTCRENVVVGSTTLNLVIDGQGTAIIDGSGNLNAPAVMIRGRGITIRGFTIVGGRHGVQLFGGGSGTVERNQIRDAAVHGVGLHEGASGRVLDNTIENNGANGICVCEHSIADIGFRGDFSTQPGPNIVRNNRGNGIVVVDTSYAEIQSNTISGNAGAGIVVENSSSAKVGFQSGVTGTFSGPNTIELNGARGIVVARSSSARIVDNVIRNNAQDGVGVIRGSQADIAANAIDGNGWNGVLVNQNSGVNLGNDTGTAAADRPNTTTAPNALHGIRCSINASADGRLGTLTGALGPKNFSASCADSLDIF